MIKDARLCDLAEFTNLLRHDLVTADLVAGRTEKIVFGICD